MKNISENQKEIVISKSQIISGSLLTAEQQAELTPDMVIAYLKKGNEDYVKGNLIVRDSSPKTRDASMGQYPGAVVLSCLDSRVSVEDVFHRGIGDLFVARVAGNVVSDDILGSMEYGCKAAGAKLILVLGHEYCGAVKSAIDDVKLGNITGLLAKIRPAMDKVPGFEGTRNSSDPEFVKAVCAANVHLSIAAIRTKSPVLKEMEAAGEIKIIGAVYDMKTGKVNFL